MVKKIKLDFSKVEERSGWNTKIIPEGLHKMKIVAVTDDDAADGTAMLTYALVPADKRYAARRFPYYCKQQPNQMWKLRDLLVAAGQSVPKKAQLVDPNAVVGKFVACEVGDGTGQYSNRSEINGVYGLDVLDDAGDDEPGDEDADSEDEGDEDEEADEEDEDDEPALSDLTLAELRKLAKPLGIEGYLSLKKDALIEAIIEAEEEVEDDEDDLDDEDLEDEELDEEEFEDDDEDEEPEPAPKRRAAAKPAAKPAARKAAPAKAAAPAKRVVKRR